MTLSKMLGACALGAILSASLLVAAPTAHAQGTLTPPATLLPTAGTKEIGVAGNYSFNGDKPYAVQGSYGIFTAPSVEFGVVGAVSGASHGRTSSSAGAFADYYFAGGADSQLLPYLGVFAGYSHVNEDSASVGAQGGVKYFFNPNIALNVELNYRARPPLLGNVQPDSRLLDLLPMICRFGRLTPRVYQPAVMYILMYILRRFNHI